MLLKRLNKCEKFKFIAEIGVNHEGKLKNALKHLGRKRRRSSVGQISSIQSRKNCFTAREIILGQKAEKETSQLKLYRRFDDLTLKDYQKIYIFCKKIKIKFIITPLI